MSEFVPYGQPIDLTNCDREPIHVPGQIQPHGFLLAVDRETLEIVQASDNVAQYLGRSLLGTKLDSVVPDMTSIRRAFERERAPVHAYCGTVAGVGPFDVIAHADGALGIVEAEPAQRGEVAAPDFYGFASQTVSRLAGLPATTREHCQSLADTIRELTGYDRVMIYRFAEDWSGHVWAESMVQDKGLSSYLDLHYPASDIPAQARALFLKNSVRMLVDAAYVPARIEPELRHGAPLDMSHAFLRGASQMYTEYLLNMGVTASLTLALSDRDKLWGLVACHHYSPRRVTHGVRVVCELLSRVASLQIVDRLHADQASYRARIAAAHSALIEAFANGGDPSLALSHAPGVVKALVDCQGVAIVHRGKVNSEGLVPLDQHVARIAAMLVGTRRNEVVATDNLLELYPEAAQFPQLACGLLAMPIPGVLGDYLMWFRPEITRTVKWAGDPRKPVSLGPMGDRLTPRKSFELWTETVRGRAEPWTQDELRAAEQLRSSATELLVRRTRELERLNEELARSNAELDAFAYVASHDLKEPLRAMYNHAAFLLRDAGDRLTPEDTQRGESIIRLVKRTRELIDALLDYSRAGRLELALAEVDVDALLERVLEQIGPRVREARAELRVVGPLPRVRAVPAMLEQVFANLLTNALKYSVREPRIEVGALAAGEAKFPARALGASHAFYVRDNGIGIQARHLQTVFTIFKRLHAQDKFGGGSGAGLTIVKKVVERMNGEVWLESEPGEGTTAWFCIGREQRESGTWTPS